MNIIDTHCDTICAVADYGKSLFVNDLDFDFTKVNKNNHHTQFFACFISPEHRHRAVERCIKLIGTLYEQAKSGRFRICTNLQELESARRERKSAAFISIEGGECITDVSVLRAYYELGVRLSTLTWNHTNHLAGGAHDINGRGLTDFGKKIVKEMNRIGMFIDVSHLNRASFYDVARITDTPLVASHSCSYALCQHMRNLTDEQFKIICESGGYVGINFYPPFLRGNGADASYKDITAHILHFLELGGENTVGMGSDFDGMDGLMPDGIKDVTAYDIIADDLRTNGVSESQIQKIMSGNAERIIGLM